MKNSGIEWIGEIPVGWIRTSLLNMLSAKISDGPHETPVLLDKGIPFISVDSLNNSENIDFSVVKKFISEEDYLRYYKKADLTKGDILFSKAATIGKTAIVGDEKFMVWSPIAIIKPNISRCDNKYIYYVLNCSGLIKQISLMGSHNTQINVGMRELEKVQIPVPPLTEQYHIADFLDEKCAKIDAVIEKQKQVIEKLKEYKLSVITEAVTKGLDPTVPMKDSGVEWIGEIPNEWQTIKLKYLLTIKSGDAFDVSNLIDNGNYPVFGGGEQIGYCDAYNTEENNILIGRVGARCGCITLTKQKSWATDNALIVSSFCEAKYLYYLLVSVNLNKLNTANAQPLITGTKVKNCTVVYFDNEKTQQDIVSFLDEKCSEIDSAIVKKQSIIEKLTEYKKSLIYEVVTGKKEV